jgi:DNA-binding CsgD family transcriptional regulator
MTRVLFLPNPHTLIWLELDQPAEHILSELQNRTWLPPPPFDNLPADVTGRLNATCQDGIITITVRESDVDRPAPILPVLTQREREVLKGLAEGLTSRQIGLRLKISQRMVGYYVAQLKSIFQAQARADLLLKASGYLKINKR